VRILDLCCHLGQWSAQLTKLFKDHGKNVEVTLADVSEKALALAYENVSALGAQVEAFKCDVLEDLNELKQSHYDIVIADPPAFIKAKKDIPTGKGAYLKMNTGAFKLARKGGYVVSCSCSGLLTEEEFAGVLRKAASRSGRFYRGILHGGHSPDHPVLLNFPEGFYLKMWTHVSVE
jgi:23S rRNA (cytosine1962-C5)-methyltransferase